VPGAGVKVRLGPMYSVDGLVLLVCLGLLAALWRDSLAARETALRAAVAACVRSQVQFLDGALAIVELGLRRDGRGRLRIWRLYEFEFSLDGRGRFPGRVAVLGARVESVQLDRPDGTLIEGEGRVV